MFDLGADLATPLDAELSYEPLRITEGQVDKLERDIDLYNDRLEPLKSFILPGGQRDDEFVNRAPNATLAVAVGENGFFDEGAFRGGSRRRPKRNAVAANEFSN